MKNLSKYLYGLAAGLFLSGILVACSNDKPTPVPDTTINTLTDEPECDKPGQRDDQGRPIPQC